MFDQQFESASNKLIQFIQDLTLNIQTIFHHENFIELFHLRCDYAKQLASLFHILIEEFLINRIIQITLNLDPVHIWRVIQNSIDQLNDMQWKDLDVIIKHIRIVNKYFYNLLLQIKNPEFLNIDQTRTLNKNLIEELNLLSQSLIHLTTVVSINNTPKPMDTYLFQGVSTTECSNNNNHLNDSPSTEMPAMNSNCYSYNMTNNLPSFSSQPMGCGNNPGKANIPPPLCFPTPVVYTPEMETLSSSGGIIYARKSGNTWVAENLGTLIETLKDIGQTIDMNEHCEILVRKTGELFVRRKRGRRKRFLQQTLNKISSPGNEQSDSNLSNNDDDD